jgi:hypothetical protein
MTSVHGLTLIRGVQITFIYSIETWFCRLLLNIVEEAKAESINVASRFRVKKYVVLLIIRNVQYTSLLKADVRLRFIIF